MKIGKMFTAAATLAGVVYVKSTRNKKIAIEFFCFFFYHWNAYAYASVK